MLLKLLSISIFVPINISDIVRPLVFCVKQIICVIFKTIRRRGCWCGIFFIRLIHSFLCKTNLFVLIMVTYFQVIVFKIFSFIMRESIDSYILSYLLYKLFRVEREFVNSAILEEILKSNLRRPWSDKWIRLNSNCRPTHATQSWYHCKDPG